MLHNFLAVCLSTQVSCGVLTRADSSSNVFAVLNSSKMVLIVELLRLDDGRFVSFEKKIGEEFAHVVGF